MTGQKPEKMPSWSCFPARHSEKITLKERGHLYCEI